MMKSTFFLNPITAKKAKGKFAILAMLLMFFLPSNLAFSQVVDNYLFSQYTGTYTPISTGTEIAFAADNSSTGNLSSGIYNVALPFDFKFANVNYSSGTMVNVSTNGFITFGSVSPLTSLSAPLSSTVAFDGVIAAFAGNLSSFANINGVTGRMKYEVRGSAPNRIFVIEWQNFRPSSSASAALVYSFSFQIQLFETTNNVAAVYDAGSYLVGSTAITGSRQVGLRGATNADFHMRTNTSAQSFTASTLAIASNYQQINTLNAVPGMPNAGFTYLWQAPTCFPPSAIRPTLLTQNSISLGWTNSVSSPSAGYDVYYSTSNVAPDASTVLNASNSVSTMGTGAAISGLASGTKYYFWVRAKCTPTDIGTWSPNAFVLATACPPVSTFFENFDYYNSSSIIQNTVPPCWFLNRPSLNPGTEYIYTSYTNSAPNSIYLLTGSTQNSSILVMPEFSNINAGTHRLRFFGRTSAPSNSGLEIGFMTNAADETSFSNIVTVALTTSVAEYTVTIPNTVPSGARLAIRSISDGRSYHVDDLYWEDATLATNESLNGKKELVFYPNPFTEYVKINSEKSIRSCIITDNSGRVVKVVENPQDKIMLKDLNAGLYFIKVIFKDGKTEIFKSIKKD